MNKKVCGNCGNYYDENIIQCPFCGFQENNSGYNVPNMFMDSNNNAQVNNLNNSFDKFEGLNKINYEYNADRPKSSIIMEQTEADPLMEEKLAKINKRNEQVKRRKKKKKINGYFSFLLLIQSMILLFIIIISSINDLNIPVLCHYSITSIVLAIAFNFSYRNKETGIFLSIIASISMICMFIEGDYISAVIGVYILFYSFAFLIKK